MAVLASQAWESLARAAQTAAQFWEATLGVTPVSATATQFWEGLARAAASMAQFWEAAGVVAKKAADALEPDFVAGARRTEGTPGRAPFVQPGRRKLH